MDFRNPYVPKIKEIFPRWKEKYHYSSFIFPYLFFVLSDFPGGSDCKSLSTMQETQVWSVGQEDPLEKEMATCSSIEKPGGLQFMVLQRVRHNWALITFTSFVLPVGEGWIACVGLRLVEVDYFPQWWRNMLKIQIVMREWRKTVINMSIAFSAKLWERSILPWQQGA